MILKPDLIQQLAKQLRDPIHPQTACRVLGVPWSDFRDWMRQGRQDRQDRKATLACELVCAVEQAQGEAERSLVILIKSQALSRRVGTDAKAAGWLLERRFPERWALEQGQAEDTAEPQAVSDLVERLRKLRPAEKADATH